MQFKTIEAQLQNKSSEEKKNINDEKKLMYIIMQINGQNVTIISQSYDIKINKIRLLYFTSILPCAKIKNIKESYHKKPCMLHFSSDGGWLSQLGCTVVTGESHWMGW